MQWLGLRRDANNRPGIGRPRIGLTLPYFAVEPDAAELTGDHHALGTAQRGRNGIGAVGVFEPACEALPFGRGVANKADIKAPVGGVGLRSKRQPAAADRPVGLR